MKRSPHRDFRIPPGYEVVRIEAPGYEDTRDTVLFLTEPPRDVWYEAFEGKRKIGAGVFHYSDQAVDACVKDAETHRFGRSRYEIIGGDDEEKPEKGCGKCGKEVEDDGARVLWRCHMCNTLLCRACTLTIPGSKPTQYFDQTLCSHTCWKNAGRPEE